MDKIATFFILIFGLFLALILAAGWANDQAAAARQAEAAIIRAEGQAALARAEAAILRAEAVSIQMYAALPWGALGALAVLGLAVIALAVALAIRPSVPPQVVTREIVYLPPPGQSRHQTWQVLTAAQTVRLPAPKGSRKKSV